MTDVEAKAREAIKRKLGVDSNPELIELWTEAHREGQHNPDETGRTVIELRQIGELARGEGPLARVRNAGMEEAAKVVDALHPDDLRDSAAAIREKITQTEEKP